MSHKLQIAALAISLATFFGCSHNVVTVLVPRKVEGPKVIALDVAREPWVAQIETRLRKNGFQVLRWASQQRVREKVGDSRVEEYNQSSTRYVLVINAEAHLDSMHRCFGGGYKFRFITADLVDTRTNETMFSYSGSGYSEDCPPSSGTIFGDITNALNASWGSN